MELWDVYDKQRNKTGRLHERGRPLADGDYHLVVHVWIVNDEGKIMLTQRQRDKTNPMLWECPGGSVLAGEDSLTGALREVNEETGINLTAENGTLVKTVRRDHFNDFYDVWLFHESINLSDTVLQAEEVRDVKLVTRPELQDMFAKDKVVPTLSY